MKAKILLFTVFIVFLTYNLFSQGPGFQWQYYRDISLTSTTPSSDFQIKITLSAGQYTNMMANGEDLRFYDEFNNKCDYWIETWNTGGTSYIWVEVATAGTDLLQMYYGNSGASAESDGDATFIFFDDFPGSGIDAAKWDTKIGSTGAVTVSGGAVTINSGSIDGEGSQIIAKTGFDYSTGTIIETIIGAGGTANSTECGTRGSFCGATSLSGTSTFFTVDEPDNSQYACWSIGRDGYIGTAAIHRNSGGAIDALRTGDYNANDLAAVAIENGRVQYFINNVSQTINTTNTPATTLYPVINYMRNGCHPAGNRTILLNQIRVRKFLNTYSTNVVVGAETKNSKPIGNGIYTDGVNDYVRIPNAYYTFTNQITVEAWVYFNNDNCWMGQSIADVDNMASNVWIWHDNGSNGLTWYVNDNGTWRNISYTPTLGWHHVATVANASGLYIYIDGVLVQSGAGISSGIRNVSGSVIDIGKDSRFPTGVNRESSAIYDEVRIWNTARSQVDIQSTMNTMLNGDEIGLVGYYRMDQGIAGGDNTGLVNEVIDNTGNCRKGTMYNFARNGATSNWVSTANDEAPIPTTYAATSIQGTEAQLNGEILSIGGSNVTTRGFCYSTSDCPTINDDLVNEAGTFAAGTYNLSATGLSSGTTYYYRSYATNSQGTSYGEVQSFATTAYTPLGNALDFDGTNDAVSIADNATLDITNQYTFETWVYIDSYQYGTLITKFEDDGNNRGWMINFGELGDNSRLYVVHSQLGTWTNAIQWNTGFSAALNTWYHIAVVYDGTLGSGNIKLYVNGSFFSQTNWAYSTTPNAANVLIGGYDGSGNGLNAGPNSRLFNGKMDEVRLWNIPLTEADIQNNMYDYLNGNEAGLIAYYRFDQGVADGNNTTLVNEVIDYSGNCNKGTLTNFARTGATSNWVHPGNPEAPIPTTYTASLIASTSAQLNGEIFAIGETDVTERGFCYSTSDCPTIDDDLVNETGTYAAGTYNLSASGLNPGVTYYYRSYATNAQGTSYGEVQSFTTSFVPLGNALDFDGTDDYIEMSSSLIAPTQTQSVTIEAWVYPKAYNCYVMSKYLNLNAAQSNYFVMINGGGNIYVTADGSNTLTSTTSIPLNQWSHIAVVFQDGANNTKFYINGVLDATSGDLNYNTINGSSTYRIGIINNSVGGWLNGQIDEVRIWDDVRTETEIQNNLYSYLVGNESGLVAYYRFDQGDIAADNTGLVNELIDYSGNCNKGTLNNFTRNGATSNWVHPGNPEAPIPSTSAATSIASTSAQLNGEIFAIGETDVTTRGFCYSTSDCPTIDDDLVNETGTYA
ncbi:MAG: DUF2341 domain-containing protein, partial [Bacteroidales bacterium]|nr:DUF2341 domain-containing protein [Bacteroidales bacterium]